MRKAILLIFALIQFSISWAQDSTIQSSVFLKPHSANKAANRSAMLPGWGQIYNKQYIKVPIIYAAAAGLVYGVVWNNKQYQTYLSAYKLDSDTASATASEFVGIYSVDNLITLKDYYRRNRDLTAIVLLLLYAANIVDAYVYAQFYNFDVSDDLSLRIKPFILPASFQNNTFRASTAGLSLTFNLK